LVEGPVFVVGEKSVIGKDVTVGVRSSVFAKVEGATVVAGYQGRELPVYGQMLPDVPEHCATSLGRNNVHDVDGEDYVGFQSRDCKFLVRHHGDTIAAVMPLYVFMNREILAAEVVSSR
jgi:hypothetical protein